MVHANTEITLRTLENAIASFQNGNLSEAGMFCESVLAANPDEANALHILGSIRLRQGDASTAIDLLNRARKAAPRNTEISINLGAALRAAGRPGEAAKLLRKAVKRAPASTAAHLNLANACRDAGEAGDAERHYRRVLQIDPAHTGAHRALGDLLADSGRPAEALDVYEALAKLAPGDTAVLNAIGALRARTGNFEQAGDMLRRALELDPSNMDVAANLANVLSCQFRYADARPLYSRLVAARPASADMLSNAGNGHVRGGEEENALDCFRRALDLDPDHADANAGLANFLLARGRFREGWAAYLRRPSMARAGSGFHRTALPVDLAGRVVNVVADQGLGDEIFFLRFAAALKRRGAVVRYLPEPRLVEMLKRSRVVDEVLTQEADLAGDYLMAVGDLPHALGMADDDTPPPSISLEALPDRIRQLRSRLEAFGPGPWTGVTWRAGTPNRQRLLFKEMDREALARAISGVEGTIVAIQRSATPAEIAEFSEMSGRPVLDLSAVNDDLEDMLALAGLLDRYVAVSNTLVHLRTACGLHSDVLIPIPADFRWMSTGAQSPWFPGTRVYRQGIDGEWGPALATLSQTLAA